MKDAPKLELVNIPLHQLEEMFEKLFSKYTLSKPTQPNLEFSGRMNQKEAAKFIGRSETTMVKYKKAGLLPFHEVPGTSLIIYYKTELVDFMRRTPELHKPSRK